MKRCISVYISGSITGLDRKTAKGNFLRASGKLKDYLKPHFDHVAIFNPMDKPGTDEGIPYEECLAVDFAMVQSCDACYFMDKWENSRGARRENHIAQAYEKLRFFDLPDGSIEPDDEGMFLAVINKIAIQNGH